LLQQSRTEVWHKFHKRKKLSHESQESTVNNRTRTKQTHNHPQPPIRKLAINVSTRTKQSHPLPLHTPRLQFPRITPPSSAPYKPFSKPITPQCISITLHSHPPPLPPHPPSSYFKAAGASASITKNKCSFWC
jgi:hypothetical protein